MNEYKQRVMGLAKESMKPIKLQKLEYNLTPLLVETNTLQQQSKEILGSIEELNLLESQIGHLEQLAQELDSYSLELVQLLHG